MENAEGQKSDLTADEDRWADLASLKIFNKHFDALMEDYERTLGGIPEDTLDSLIGLGKAIEDAERRKQADTTTAAREGISYSQPTEPIPLIGNRPTSGRPLHVQRRASGFTKLNTWVLGISFLIAGWRLFAPVEICMARGVRVMTVRWLPWESASCPGPQGRIVDLASTGLHIAFILLVGISTAWVIGGRKPLQGSTSISVARPARRRKRAEGDDDSQKGGHADAVSIASDPIRPLSEVEATRVSRKSHYGEIALPILYFIILGITAPLLEKAGGWVGAWGASATIFLVGVMAAWLWATLTFKDPGTSASRPSSPVWTLWRKIVGVYLVGLIYVFLPASAALVLSLAASTDSGWDGWGAASFGTAFLAAFWAFAYRARRSLAQGRLHPLVSVLALLTILSWLGSLGSLFK